MESQHQKWVNLSYLGFSALFSYVVFSLSGRIVGAYDLETRVRQIDLILRVASIAVGAVVFIILLQNRKANQFMNEVMLELERVTWPSQKDTMSATGIVIVMVLVSGVILGILDYIWVQLLRWSVL